MPSGESLASKLARGVRVDLPRWRVMGYAKVPVLIDVEVTATSREEALAVAAQTLAGDPEGLVQVQEVQKGMVVDWQPNAMPLPPRQIVNHHAQPLTAPKFVCRNCGSLFPWQVSTICPRRPKYCGDKCRVYAWRQKRRAKVALEGKEAP